MRRFSDRELRFPVPLNQWIFACYFLSAFFYTVSAVSTYISVKNGLAAEMNPFLRTVFEHAGVVQALIIMEIVMLSAGGLLLFLLRNNQFLVLLAAHFITITLALSAINDTFHLANAAYLFNIVISIALSLLLTKMLTIKTKPEL